jgi:nucleoside-diphosphate-sugar epimerase
VSSHPKQPVTLLVTGGRGFVGGAIVRALSNDGHAVRSLGRSDAPELRALGVETFQGDVADPTVVRRAMEGCDGVFHVAAKVGGWGRYEEFFRVNVQGTRNIIASCKQLGVSQLIYTSTPSVVHAGTDLEGVDESVPYAEHFEAHYPATKALAERAVLRANGDGLATVALRPHLVWGPGDNHMLPRVVARARAGRIRLLSGPAKRVDTLYIDNAVDAHLGAFDELRGAARCAGKAYFIAQGEPIESGALINTMLATVGVAPVERRVPPQVAYAAGWLAEKVYGALGRDDEPPITRFAASQLATSHYFDIGAAKRDFGYEPRISFDEGLERLRAAYRDGTHFGAQRH